jgi:hypothetical protein
MQKSYRQAEKTHRRAIKSCRQKEKTHRQVSKTCRQVSRTYRQTICTNSACVGTYRREEITAFYLIVKGKLSFCKFFDEYFETWIVFVLGHQSFMFAVFA